MIANLKPGIDYIGVCVVFFCHDGKGNFLMGKRGPNARDEHGRWDIGSEALEPGEDFEKTLQRGIKEEYSAKVLEYEFLGCRSVCRQQGYHETHWVAIDFKVKIDPAEVKNGEPSKFDEIGWFNPKKLPAKTHSQFPEFLNLYNSSLR